MRTVDNIYNLY